MFQQRRKMRYFVSWAMGLGLLGLFVLAGCGRGSPQPALFSLPPTFQVHFGDDPAWKSPTFDDRAWSRVPVPAPLKDGNTDYRGFYWYRVWFVPPATSGNELGLTLGTIGDIDEVFLNGQAIGRSGRFYPGGRIAFHLTRVYRLPGGYLKANQPNLLAIRGQKVTFLQAGIYKGQVGIGDYASLQARADRGYFLSSRLSLFFGLFSLILGLYHLFLYLRLPQKRMNLWYFLFSLASSVFMISLGWKFAEWVSPLAWIIGIHAVSGILSVMLFLVYTALAIGRGFSWPVRGLLAVHGLFLIPVVLLGDQLRIYQVFTLWYPWCFITIVYLLWLTAAGVRQGRRDLSFLTGAMAVMLVTAVLDICYGLGWIDLFQISSSGFFALNLGIMFSLAHDFTAAYINVEQQVATRTEQLAKAHRELQTLDAAKDRFFSNISHELRTPLTLALAPLDGFLEEAAGKDAKLVEDFRGVRNNLRRLLNLINDLLLLAKLESDKLNFAPRRLLVVPWLRRLVEMARPLAEKKGIALAFHSGLAETTAVAVDTAQLEKVPLNLISNALKFTPAGGKIEVQLAAGRELVMTVADSGCGIPAEKLDKVFERFEQAKDEHRSGGTGIGLSLLKEIVELHQGQVEVSSVEGQGSTFTVHLPWAPAGKSPDDFPADETVPTEVFPDIDVERSPAKLGPPDGALLAPSLPAVSGGKLLVVEDNPQLRRLLRDLLGRTYEIREAEHGEQALEALADFAPDCILTDVMMPVMDGVTFVARLRQNPERHSIPVIVCTSKQDPEDKLAAFAAGANDYVTKPFDRRELRARVEAQVRLKRIQEQLVQAGKLAALGTLTAGICHEIRNPLNNISACALRLTEGMPAEELREVAAFISSEIERADKIVQDLLQFCRSERQSRRPVLLRDLAQEVLGYLKTAIDDRIAVHLQIPPELTLHGQPNQIKQVLLDLLLNALQAIRDRGNVWLQATPAEGNAVEIRVRDDGCGMRPEVLDRIFEPFYTTKGNGHGTGLGLSIAHQIISDHGGRIWVESESGQGTAVYVSIPNPVQGGASL